MPCYNYKDDINLYVPCSGMELMYRALKIALNFLKIFYETSLNHTFGTMLVLTFEHVISCINLINI